MADSRGRSGTADVLALHRQGEPVVVVAETADGRGAPLLQDLGEELTPSDRAAAGEATRGSSGCLVSELDIDGLDGRVVLVEQAQWADATSLGRLQRWIQESQGPYLLLLTVPPGPLEWGVAQVVETAHRHGRVVELTYSESSGLAAPDDPAARDLVLGAGLMTESLPVDVAARLLETDEDRALELAEELVRSGHLVETRRGFNAAVPTGEEWGAARSGRVASRLARILEDAAQNPAVVGELLVIAGEPAAAFPHLEQASHTAAEAGAGGEVYHLATKALQAAREGNVGDRGAVGSLCLLVGRYLRQAGRSAEAAQHLDEAVRLLTGPSRIDALGFAAAVADDRQNPQTAERILAAAEWEAARQREEAKLASLFTFRARALARIGFAPEADAVMAKALGMVTESTGASQRLFAESNRAWIAFDRGMMREAETHFSHVRDLLDPQDSGAVADKEAWLCRVLFARGRADEALAASTEAKRRAADAEVEAPAFLADLGMAEGCLGFGRYEEALQAVDRVHDLVVRQLPAWENVARATRASILSRSGRNEEAARELAAARDVTPSGANGWRWRSRIEALEIENDIRTGGDWDRRAAEDLVDMLLQAQLLGWAADLLCAMAEADEDHDVASEAMALALRNGTPLVAARAAQAGRLWGTDSVGACVRAVRAIEPHVPESWRTEWKKLPGITEAMSGPVPTDDTSTTENTAVLVRAFERAGLSPEGVPLSPAQRRKQGLVPARSRKRRTPMRVLAAMMGVVAVAALTSVGIAALDEEPAPVTVVREIPVEQAASEAEEEATTLEETQIELPETTEFLFGVAPFRGGPGRPGTSEGTGPSALDGYYWIYQTTGPVVATPVAYGRNLLVPSTDGSLYAVDQSSGELAWTLETGGRLTASPEVVVVEGSEGQSPAMAVVGGDDGVLRAREAVRENLSEEWAITFDGRIASTPVVSPDGKVFAATTDGFVHAVDVALGEEIWRFPSEGEGLGPITAPLAFHDGLVYVGAEDGDLYLLEAGSGQERCSFTSSASIVAPPMVVDEVLYLPTRGNTIFVRPAGACDGTAPDRLPLYGTETPVEIPPAIVGDTMYLPAGQFLYAIDLTDNTHVWSASTVDAGDPISAAPVYANGVVYFGTRTGLVMAVDGETGETLWEWQTGNVVRASPVVVDGAVFVASGDGAVYALGTR